MINSFSQKSLIFIWCSNLLDSLFLLFLKRNEEEEMRMIEVCEMSNIRIFTFEFINIYEFEVNDIYFESDYFDWNITIFIINNYILSEIIEYIWICIWRFLFEISEFIFRNNSILCEDYLIYNKIKYLIYFIWIIVIHKDFMIYFYI